MKRLLFQIHRWLGISAALFMVLWFFSGLVIIYAPALNQSKLQQQAHAETLKVESGWLSLGEAWQASAGARREAAKASRPDSVPNSGQRAQADGNHAEASSARTDAEIVDASLVRHAGLPVWLVDDSRGRRYAISAIDGSLHRTSGEEALVIAAAWADDKAVSPRLVETADQFASLRNSEGLRPFHRVALDDGAGRELIISARSGEVLQDATRVDRALYWAGNWLHMFRPLDFVGWGSARHDVLTWVSGVALISALTGLIIGWLRWRPGWFGRPTYAEGRTQPYRAPWFRWHFWAGLTGGVLAFLWVLSGFLNNNPWHLFGQASPSREEIAKYRGAEVPQSMMTWQPSPMAVWLDSTIVELSWHRLGDEAVLIAHDRSGQRIARDTGRASFSVFALDAAIRRIGDNARIERRTPQSDYDAYYYPRHNRSPAERPLPVIRAELDDDVHTVFYIDPADGRILARQDDSRRTFRWLFSALHHWDFGWLYQSPLWDVWMVAWCLAGLVLSVTATVIGWRRLGRTLSFRQRNTTLASQEEPLVTENPGA